MVKYLILSAALSLCLCCCLADTFIHRDTGQSLDGFAVQKKISNETLVRTTQKGPQYLDLTKYDINPNSLGRRNKIYVLPIKDRTIFEYETKSFEDAIVIAANQGPLFIVVEIDTPGGNSDLAQCVSAAITKIWNCRTIAFVSGGEFGGAYSTGAMIALACDELYMAENTVIGGLGRPEASSDTRNTARSSSNVNAGRPFQQLSSAHSDYMAALAEQNSRPNLLAEAMAEPNMEVFAITKDGSTTFASSYPGRKKDHLPKNIRQLSEKCAPLALTSRQAVDYGIADEVAASLRQLLINAGASDAKIVRNNECKKAKHKFERAWISFGKLSDNIAGLEERANKSFKELEYAESQMRNAKIGMRSYRSYRRPSKSRYYSRYYKYRSAKETFKIYEEEQEKLLEELLIILNNLKSNYEDAIRLAQQYGDLNADMNSLRAGMNSASMRYQELGSRQRN